MKRHSLTNTPDRFDKGRHSVVVETCKLSSSIDSISGSYQDNKIICPKTAIPVITPLTYE